MKHIFLNLMVVFTLVFLTSCSKINNDNTSEPAHEEKELVHVKNSSPDESLVLTNEEIATRLANIAGTVHDVNDAAAVVAGPFTVIGIDLDANLDRQKVGTVKYSVAEAVRHDKYGKTALIIADADLMQRFRQMGQDIKNGRPVQGVVEELANIVNRYIPDVPVEEERYNNGDKNNDLRQEDEEKLKDIQDRQANE